MKKTIGTEGGGRAVRRRHQVLWLAVLAGVVLGGAVCFLTGRTAAHGLTIAAAGLYLAGTVYLADVFLPHGQSARVRTGAALMFGLTGLMLFAFYAWHYLTARYVYIFDYSLYYYQQLELAEKLSAGLAETLAFVGQSFRTDYTYVPNLLMAPLFSLTDRSIQGFGLAGVVMTWPLILYQLRRITLRMADRLHLTEGRALLLCAGVCLSVFALPVLHKAAAWGQINLLGMPVLLTAVHLSWNADFARPRPLRLLALFLSVLLLVMLRRWFILFLAGYLLCWGLASALRSCLARDWRALRNLLVYGAVCAALGLTLLWPLFDHAIRGNYTVAYAYWNNGGLPYELRNQTWLAGGGTCLLILAGYAWGLLQRRSPELRRLAGVLLTGAAVTLILFSSIQIMNDHQATILMPAYVLGLVLLFGMLASLGRSWLRRGGAVLLGAALLLQWGVCVTHDEPEKVVPLLPHLSLKPPVREDLDAIREVSDLVSDTCGPESPALFLCNSDQYDRLTFVNIRYPDLTIRHQVALDRIALPSDGFPRAWFAAKYLIVPTRVQTNQPGGTVEKLTRFVLEDAADCFEEIGRVPFGEFDMLILQRKEPPQWDEAEALMALFTEENGQNPTIWHDRIRWFWEQQVYNPGQLRFG